jgi:hypothetical protein
MFISEENYITRFSIRCTHDLRQQLSAKYLTGNKCEFWQTEPDAVQGGECAAVRALQARANAATRRLWQPKTHLFMGEYLCTVIAERCVFANPIHNELLRKHN